jgi:hypothetical protein
MWFLEVTNETDKEIVMENKAAGNIHLYATTINPGQRGTVLGVLFYGSNKSGGPQQDNLSPDDFLPFGDTPTPQLPEGEYWVEMTVDGTVVSGEIWKRKHWSFRSTDYDRWYLLTITDAFLESLIHQNAGQ